jgi:hypothetical protein
MDGKEKVKIALEYRMEFFHRMVASRRIRRRVPKAISA